MNGTVVAICICPIAGEPMQEVPEAEAVVLRGLTGDRYASGEGSFNKDKPGRRQVTLMNAIFFEGSGFDFKDSRRNLFVKGVELMSLIGEDFHVGNARLRGVKYCDPCTRPSKLSGKKGFREGFKEAFLDRGGLIAEIIESGIIKTGDAIIPPPKGY